VDWSNIQRDIFVSASWDGVTENRKQSEKHYAYRPVPTVVRNGRGASGRLTCRLPCNTKIGFWNLGGLDGTPLTFWVFHMINDLQTTNLGNYARDIGSVP
jgi:hypothetical protein